MRAEYRLEPCKSALNPVRGMAFKWSLNPYMGCVHRCTFCYVRHFEQRADRPSDGRYGRSIRVKTNIAEVLRRELARPSLGARERRDRRRDRSLPARRGPLPADPRVPRRAHGGADAVLDHHARAARVRDVDVLQQAAAGVPVTVTFSIPTLDERVWRTTEPGTAPPAQPARGGPAALRSGHRRRRRDGADPARALRPARAAARGRPRRPRGRCARHLGQRPLPQARGRASTSSSASPRTGPRRSAATRSSTRAARTCPPRSRAGEGRGTAAAAASRRCAAGHAAAQSALASRRAEQLALAV